MDMEFFVVAFGVNPQGVPCHAEFVGDFLHEVAFGQEGEDSAAGLVEEGLDIGSEAGMSLRSGEESVSSPQECSSMSKAWPQGERAGREVAIIVGIMGSRLDFENGCSGKKHVIPKSSKE